MSAPPEAAANQRRAADPAASTWLAANAGSGKTRVLTERVARLLLDGTDPAHVLCLTYTKAAAAEMQARLFRSLGAWAMRPDDALRESLAAIGLDGPFDADRLAAARRLFARALETPGGLRIQTIHAFCASLLRRFPLEAGVAPQFRELDERDAARLRDEVAADLVAGPEAALVDAVARHLSDTAFAEMADEILAHRDAFRAAPDDAALRGLLGVGADADEDALCGWLGQEGTRALLRDAAALCDAGGATDARVAEALRRAAQAPRPGPEHLALLEEALLFGADAKAPFAAKVGKVPVKAARARDPDLAERLDELMRAVEARREARLGLRALARNRDLLAFGAALVRRYEAAKAARGLLDFDDLIARARDLLTDPAVAQWVLWRLDGGIDHILVDEAQDTSPAQWAVIERLADEFAAGAGAGPARARTLFVVGDRKQSIYSFQGADVAAFDAMRARFAERLGGAGRPLRDGRLEHSFRSAAPVLEVVDAVFRDFDGLGAEPPRHVAGRAALPGRVDLWPPVPKPAREAEARRWTDPVDAVRPLDPDQILAARVAEAVDGMLGGGTLPVETPAGWARRPVTPGDILILVQRRSPLFAGIIRELKARGLEVAGADRLELGRELAVQDVEAVLRVLALPQDDLALACALKSPLFGWDEARLYALAHPRPPGATLWEALDAVPGEARDILRDLRGRADFLRPYELVSRLLVRHGGRARLVARLGPEADDALDALLAQALAYEAREVPSLTGFLEWRARDDAEVKRQMDAAGGRIRVMTVHGAKGLESPVVILPDCADRGSPRRGALLAVPGGARLWGGARDDLPAALRDAHEAMLAAERRERRRLLYVAMTRSESWLVVCAAGACGPDSWHAQVEAGLRAAGAVEALAPGGTGLRAGGGWDHLPDLAAPADGPGDAPPGAPFVDPGPLAGPAAGAPARPAPRAATDLGGAKLLEPGPDGGASRAGALARGTLMHLALEHLPRADAATVRALLAATEEAALAGDLDALVADAARLVAAPGLAPLWDPAALAEADVTADLPGLGRLRGTVDRLLVGADAVTAVDFKTNRDVPARPEEVPEGLLRQMGAYQAALEAVYPGRRVGTALLWTATAALMPLPRALVMAALQRARDARLDAPGPGS